MHLSNLYSLTLGLWRKYRFGDFFLINRVNMEREVKKEDPNFILRCGGKREQHFENDGKLYGIRPVCHCDTNCPYKEGTCHTYCLGLPITQRQCLKEDYKNSI